MNAVLFEDDSVLGEFASDGSCVYISPTGTWTVSWIQGARRQQLTNMATSSLRPRVAALLRFRNRHTPSALLRLPEWAVLEPEEAMDALGGGSPRITWPAATSTENTTVNADGSVTVSSRNQHARLTLASHGHSLRVSFPVATEALGYLWLQQSHPVVACPACWRQPLRLARQWQRREAPGPRPLSSSMPKESGASSMQPPVAQGVPQTPSVDIIDLPRARPEPGLSVCGLTKAIRVELWEEGVTFHVHHSLPPAVYADIEAPGQPQSCCVCTGASSDEVRHDTPDGSVVYAAASLPPQLVAHPAKSLLWRVIQHTAQLHQQASALPGQSPGPASVPIALSNDVVRAERAVGVGQLTAYADGRVRLVHEDRTLVELDARGEFARVITREGAVQEVRVACPVGVELYVELAARFGYETFAGAEVRAAQKETREAVMMEMEKIRARLTSGLPGMVYPRPVPGRRDDDVDYGQHGALDVASAALARNAAAMHEAAVLRERLGRG